MDRQKALIASAALAGSLVTGGVAYAFTGGALAPRQDNVGKLQPTTSLVSAPPATAPPATVSKASPSGSYEHEDDGHEHEEHEHEYDSDGDDD